MNLPDRIACRIVTSGRGDPDGCWRWLGAHNAAGYGIAHSSTSTLVHRIAYEALVGAIPDGLDLDHLCRNRGCCNPAHLEPVTRAENLRRSPVWNGNRDECRQGHALDGVNSTLGSRFCRTCHRETRRRWQARNRARSA